MSLGGDIVKKRLIEVAGVYNLIGGAGPDDDNSRVYKWETPQNPAMPSIVYKLAGTERLEGTYSDPGYCKATIQVIALDKTMDGADALAEQIRLALERFGSNQPAGVPFAGTTVYDIKVGSHAEGYSFEAEVFYVTCDYVVHFQETTP